MNHRFFFFISVIFALVLASCQALGGGDSPNQPVQPGSGSAVQWDRSPSNVVFRAEIVGGDNADAFHTRSEIPDCTIYGDGQVVWTTGGGDQGQVLFDRLSDDQIQRFVEQLTLARGIYNYEAGAEPELFSDVEPVVEQLTLSVNNRTHITDSMGGWDFEFYQVILNQCRDLGQTPTIFEPEGAWVSAIATEYTTTLPTVSWSASGSGVDLAELAASGERQWVTGRIARALWVLLRDSSPDLQFNQATGTYQIALEIPNVTRDAPDAP